MFFLLSNLCKLCYSSCIEIVFVVVSLFLWCWVDQLCILLAETKVTTQKPGFVESLGLKKLFICGSKAMIHTSNERLWWVH